MVPTHSTFRETGCKPDSLESALIVYGHQSKTFGVYTVVEMKSGKGVSVWGRLKSRIGWIGLCEY